MPGTYTPKGGQSFTKEDKKEDTSLTLNSPFGVCSSSSNQTKLVVNQTKLANCKLQNKTVPGKSRENQLLQCPYRTRVEWTVPSLITVYECTIKSVYTIEMILCHCNQQCGQVSDSEKSRTFFPYKANACRTEDKTSKRRTLLPNV